MLFTRCPSCDTTFRVTDEALTKAGGQVRCGRCASVFNAYAELREMAAPSDTAPAAATPPAAAPARPSRPGGANAAVPAPVTASQQSSATPPAPQRQQPHAARESTKSSAAASAAAPPAATPSPATASAATASVAKPRPAATATGHVAAASEEPFDSLSVAAVVAQVKLGTIEARLAPDDIALDKSADADVAAPREEPAIGARGVQAVLETAPTADSTTAIWSLDSREPSPLNRWWRTGAALALLALAAQAVHHNRAELAGGESIGRWIQGAYRMFGAPITPRWDLTQYQILDATAQPNSPGNGRLEITARVHNRGPRAQPFPQIQLQLKDRWDKTVGSRVFRPSEYLDATPTPGALMSVGTGAQAHITVVDPGPDAYGFELDVCVEAEADGLTCGGDEVFR